MFLIRIFLSIILSLSVASITAAELPAAWFFDNPDVSALRLSPDGEKILVLRQERGEQSLYLRAPESHQETLLLKPKLYAEKKSAIRNLLWLDNRYIAIQFAEIREGIDNVLDTKISRRLLVLDTQAGIEDSKRVLAVRTKGWLVHPLQKEDGVFLYAKTGSRSKIYKISVANLSGDKEVLGKLDRIDGGQFKPSNAVSSVAGFAIRWFLSDDGGVEAVMHYTLEGELRLSEWVSGELKTVKEWKGRKTKQKKKNRRNKKEDAGDGKNVLSLFERVVPIAKAKGENSYYALDSNEAEDRSIYLVNFASQDVSLVYETGAFEITDIILSNTNDLVGVEVIKDGAFAREYLNDKKSEDAGVGRDLHVVVDAASASNRYLVYRESHDTPGYYTYIDSDNNSEIIVAHHRSKLKTKLQSELLVSAFQQDGLEIPYLLSLPKKNEKPLPLIVMPHGGPIGVHDSTYFDPGVQYFVSQGYAVLRVNFRGSSGHSPELKAAGVKQWGGKMLSDIHFAAQLVAKRKDIDDRKICALGFSYGGYASAMLLALHPKFYQCGLSVSGVSDVNLHINASDDAARRTWYSENVGDPASEYDELKAISPLYVAERIHAPMFIAHGENDAVVDVEQSYRLALIMSKKNKEHSLYVDEDSNHHFSDPDKKRKLFIKMRDFLDKHIGS